MNWFAKLSIGLILSGLTALPSIAQTAADGCPANLVCISREAALKALADSDRVKALEAEIKVKDTAIDGLKAEISNLRVEFARASGELTGLKTSAVRDGAIIELLLKNARPKKFGIINF